MWYLISSTGKHIYLKPKQLITFGRKKSDILLQDDESISRIHASICVEPKERIETNEPISMCKLHDVGSKYGTYVLMKGQDRIEVPSEGYSLKDQDQIRFGLQNHIFTVVYVPIITVVSTLSDNDKNKLQSIMDEIDGMISINWTSNCTDLTVSRATLTEKVICAMASAIPIVTLSYWEEVKRAVNNGEKLPKPDDFTPVIDESLVYKEVSLRPNNKRKTLFKNLIFVHFSPRQYKMYGKMISMAGGKSLLYSKNPLSHKELCAPNVVVLQYPNNDATQSSTQSVVSEYDSIYNVLKNNKRKMISESDIPLAILHSSVEKYCNPKFKFEEFLKRSQSKSEPSEILVLDTQDVTSDVRALPTIISNVPIQCDINPNKSKHATKIIPESYDSPSSQQRSANSSTFDYQELISSTPKKSKEIRDTVNSNTTVLNETVQPVKERCLKKVTKYIPETNMSFMPNTTQKDTQNDSQRIVDSRKVTKCIPETNVSSLSNTKQKDTRNDSQRIVDSRKVTKYIPETNVSSICNTTQKDTQNDSQKIVDSRKVTKYIPETNVSSLSNTIQKDTQNDSQRIVDLRKVTKYIPETNVSSLSNTIQKDTQNDSQRIVDSRKVTKYILETNVSSLSNTKQKDTQNDSQRIVDSRKVTKYIPETNVSFMSNITEKNIQRDSQKSVDSRKVTKYIPETNDSSICNTTQKDTQNDSQKILDSRKVTKYIPETNTTQKDTQNDSQRIVDSRKVTKCIPETNVSSLSNTKQKDTQNDSQRIVDSRKVTKYIPETNDSSICNTTQKDTQNDSLKFVDSGKIMKCIPETNVSFMSNITEKNIQRDSQKSVDSKEKRTGTQNIEILKEPMIANKGTPCIDLSAEDSESEGVQAVECNENVNRIPIMEDTLCKLLDTDNERDKSTEVDGNSLLKRHNKITSKEDRHASQSTSSTLKEDDHQKSKKRKPDSRQIENDEIDDELPTPRKKKIHLEDLTVEDTAQSPEVSSVPCNEEQENQSICDNLLRSTTSFVGVSTNYKRFKKVYNNVPKQRITLSDMYVWGRCNISDD